ncbi:GTPase [endosymbiont GvMRE of Glomus versiforme]|uniref:GTPase n=1 Tax=endosymbiont GvMRE of Glomus versiforme TaxID=2039283 RepID=UPI000EEE19A3|nr:GTPase [endosymbiont GvMRE of Glomus versiforme]RHZ35884.1 GTPase IMAP family member 7 [endosymbiont GvMRE of Glomus versiforme]
MTKTNAILLIGRSGRGKSALANVITSTDKFKESSGSVSETKKIQFEKFEENKINYQIIDTPGIGDTKMSDNEVLDIIAEAVYLAKDGISQVFFVTDGRFDQFEMATYDLLRTIIFDEKITEHTTITRTRFEDFKNKKKCKADIDLMVKEAKEKRTELEKSIVAEEKEMKNLSSDSAEYQELSTKTEKAKKELSATNLAEIIESCQEKVVYVDNPSIKIAGADEEELESNKKARGKSRKILLKHLNDNCQGDSYKPEKLAQLSEAIAEDYFEYLKKKEELQKELDSLKETKPISTQTPEIKGNEPKNTPSEPIAEKDNSIAIISINESIAQLQNTKARLEKEIQEKEKTIRQKVLKHIFNNYEGISKELGGDIFLSSVAGEHNWQEIHPEFANKETVLKWLKEGFDYEQTKKWTTALNDFNPQIDADFCAWLRDIKELTAEGIKRTSYLQNIERLRSEYVNYLQKETKILDEHSKQLNKRENKEFIKDYLLFIQVLVKDLQNVITDLEQSKDENIQQNKQYYQKLKRDYEVKINQIESYSGDIEKTRIFLKDYLNLMGEGIDNCDEAISSSIKGEKQYYQEAKQEYEVKIVQVRNYLEKWK